MKANTQTESAQAAAEWTVVEGKATRNNEAQRLEVEYHSLKKQYEIMEATFVGATMLALFKERPWLQSATIRLTASYEYGDEGDYYRSISSTVTDVTGVANCVVPADLADEKGCLDSEAAADSLHNNISDSSLDGDLYCSMVSPWDAEEIKLKLDRNLVAHLLEQNVASGKEAFRLLFPDEHHRIGEMRVTAQTSEAVTA